MPEAAGQPEVTLWVSLWAAVPWHGKFVCSTYLIAQATRNAFSAGVRKTERATSGLVEACRKTSLPTYCYGMVQSVALRLLDTYIDRCLINFGLSKLYGAQQLAFNFRKTFGGAWISRFRSPSVIWINMWLCTMYDWGTYWDPQS